MSQIHDIFLVAPPGLETILAQEAASLGFASVAPAVGGVSMQGDGSEVRRANVMLRGATRVLVRVAEFRAMHLAQLDKRSRKVDWAAYLRPDIPVRVEVTTRKSRIYHAGAAQSRIERAIAETVGAPTAADAPVTVKARIDDDLVTVSVDTSGESLHKRGHKEWVGKAPMRESMAALLLRMCGFTGSEAVVDPMCGSGTFVIEAAGIASGQAPGLNRRFALDDMALLAPAPDLPPPHRTGFRFHGSDRDTGAVRGAAANAGRAGLDHITCFTHAPISDAAPPDGPAGLVIVNPPYGARIGNRKQLFGLYGALGATLTRNFAGWRVGIVTSDDGLARATGLDLVPSEPIAHGGIRIRLWQSGPL